MFESKKNIAFLSNSEIAKLLAERIKKERIAQNYRQSDIAAKANLPLPTYALFERTGKISTDKMISIVRALGKLSSLSDFLDFDKERLETDAFEWVQKREEVYARKRINPKGATYEQM